jgi:hypothetical protein
MAEHDDAASLPPAEDAYEPPAVEERTPIGKPLIGLSEVTN